MKNVKIKTLLFGLLLVVSLGLKAQDRYEYAVVAQKICIAQEPVNVFINKSNAEPEFVEVDKKEVFAYTKTGHYNYTPLLRVIQNMSDEGWSVYNSIIENGCNIRYFLKRKKK